MWLGPENKTFSEVVTWWIVAFCAVFSNKIINQVRLSTLSQVC